jgi:anti-anti-sigma factor
MKRHLTTSAISSDTRSAGGAGGAVANGTHTASTAAMRARSVRGEPRLALARTTAWQHTLVLTGELDGRSAHALEAEIERLCEQGVTGITLDLRELTHIDSIGVAVIVFRCGHCRRRGFDFALIPGAPAVQAAFEQAGAIDALPFAQGDRAGSPPIRLAPTQPQEAVAVHSGRAG